MRRGLRELGSVSFGGMSRQLPAPVGRSLRRQSDSSQLCSAPERQQAQAETRGSDWI